MASAANLSLILSRSMLKYFAAHAVEQQNLLNEYLAQTGTEPLIPQLWDSCVDLLVQHRGPIRSWSNSFKKIPVNFFGIPESLILESVCHIPSFWRKNNANVPNFLSLDQLWIFKVWMWKVRRLKLPCDLLKLFDLDPEHQFYYNFNT